jgi:hypothetical protein
MQIEFTKERAVVSWRSAVGNLQAAIVNGQSFFWQSGGQAIAI